MSCVDKTATNTRWLQDHDQEQGLLL